MATEAPTTRKPARARNRRGEGGRLREEIIAAAVGLLDETGDERAITLRSVARRIGIAAPSIYPHFPDQPAIMLAVVQQEFAGLQTSLLAAVERAGDDPRARLEAICTAYLGYAQEHPDRYRTMFGGLWMPDLSASSITEQDLTTLGSESMQLLVSAFGDCVAAGVSSSDDVAADAIALWMGLHGLAHQRASTVAFPWPADIEARIVNALAHFSPTKA